MRVAPCISLNDHCTALCGVPPCASKEWRRAWSLEPVRPMRRGWNSATYCFTCATESRSGSTEMKTGCSGDASSASASAAAPRRHAASAPALRVTQLLAHIWMPQEINNSSAACYASRSRTPASRFRYACVTSQKGCTAPQLHVVIQSVGSAPLARAPLARLRSPIREYALNLTRFSNPNDKGHH